MPFALQPAINDDAVALAALHTAVAGHLTEKYGTGPWSGKTSEKGVLFAMRNSRVFVAKDGNEIVVTLRLATKKPWAIDASYFTAVKTPLYLLAMAVAPRRQQQGIGKRCMKEVVRIAKEWPADVIRLDGYDADAGAGDFYAGCGFKEVGRVTYRKAPLIYYERLLT